MWLKNMRLLLTLVALLLDPSRYITAMRLGGQLCGLEKNCAGNRTNVEQTIATCCQPCECVEAGKERDTCCAATKVLDDDCEVIPQQCLPAEYVPKGYEEGSLDVLSFSTLTRCPKVFKESKIRESCENKTAESLEDITFVSSEDGTIVYKNKFCGLCHGENRTVPWKLSVSLDCIGILMEQDLTLTTVSPNFLEHCQISLIEPDNLVSKHTLCFDNTLPISECNITGKWDVYDSNLQELCLRSPESVNYCSFGQSLDKTLVYRNMYCSLCNEQMIYADQPNTCNILNMDRHGMYFTSLIKTIAWTGMEDQERKPNKCNADQILDTFFKMCRRLYCPAFFLPSHGQCIPFLDVSFSYNLVVRLVPLQSVNKTVIVKKEWMSRQVSVLRKLGLGQCMMCKADILLEKNINETLLLGVHLHFVLKPAKTCKHDHLVSKLNSIELTSPIIKLTLNKNLVALKVLWENKTTWRGDRFEKLLTTLGGMTCPALLRPSRASNCAKVKLMTAEYQIVMKNHVYANEILFAPIQDDENGTVFVCCDKYIVNTVSVGNGKSFNVAAVMIALIIASL